MESYEKYLQKFPHFNSASFEKAKRYLSKKKLKAGAYFLQHGNVSRSIAFIEKGLLRLYYLRDGKEVTNCFCKENTLTCSYQSLITQTASDIAIQAIEDSQLLVLPYDALQKLYAEDLFWQQVGRLVSESEYVITENHNRFVRDLSATERYLQILENEKELLQRVPLNYLATYLQIAPETLSRIRKKISQT